MEEEDVLETIVDMAEQSPLLSIRGTCFFVLGLISSTTQGAELLEDLDWIPTTTPIGLTTGLCVPDEVAKFVFVSNLDLFLCLLALGSHH